MGIGGMSAQMEPCASIHGERNVPGKAAVHLWHLLSRFEPVSAAFRNGGGDAGSPVGSNHLKLVLMWAHVPLLLMRSVQLMSFLLLSC